MSTQTEHLNLDLCEASDIFNPLSTNANFETLDNVIYEIQTKGGVPTYTTTASANLLKLSDNPTPNSTVFKFVAAGDANTWSYQETVNNIIALDGTQKTVKAGEMYVAWVNSANAMVVIAWPDVVNAQTFDGKGPAEWATTAQLQAVNTTATNATTTAQAAATVAGNALQKAEEAQTAAENISVEWKEGLSRTGEFNSGKLTFNVDKEPSEYMVVYSQYGVTGGQRRSTCIIPKQVIGAGKYTYLENAQNFATSEMVSRGFTIEYSNNVVTFDFSSATKNNSSQSGDSSALVPLMLLWR